MRFIAFITSLVGLSLMLFGIYGLQAPQKVSGAVDGLRRQVYSVSRAATSTWREKLASQDGEPAARKPITPVQDPNFLPVTIEEKYSKYLYCMTAEKPCPGFSLETEGSYYNDLREQMHRELQEYHAYLTSNPLKIQKADEDFARKLLNESTPDIQVEALKIIGLFPANEENLTAMAKVLKSTRDDSVMTSGLDVLIKYRAEPAYDKDIVDVLSAQISQGTSEFTSVMTARRLFPFINQDNVGDFRKLQKNLQYLNAKYGLQEERLEALNSTLREYERDHLLRQ
jgi:hypothetical protein